MAREFHFLFVEDSPQDAELESDLLMKAGFSFRSLRVETAEALKQALREFKPDLVISDYKLPGMTGLDALRILRETPSEIPFVFVSGTIGEEVATESLKQGATDYVVKDRLDALPSKVRRALTEVHERQERRRLEEQLRQAQKMEAIGRLAGGIAHDFNNLLTVINGYSGLLLERLREDPAAKEDLEQILGAGLRAAGLTRQLLAFSRKQVTRLVPLDLNSLISGLMKMIDRILGEDVEVDLKLDPNLYLVEADPGHIEQVIMNLVVNARDAMPVGGKITIETRIAHLTDEGAAARPGHQAGTYAILAVADTGTGMSQEALDHLFEPFFTTKELGKGTGLGLSTVHGIVRQCSGFVEVASELGNGTTFEIWLPVVTTTPLRTPQTRLPIPTVRGSETILLAEDSETVRTLCEKYLQSAGYLLISACNGTQALELARLSKEPIHLLITDTVMPGIGGHELALHLNGLCPGIRILFITGYTDRAFEDQQLRNLGAGFLEKPFSREAFLARIREVLDSP